MLSLIQTWTSPVDPGGGNPGRSYQSPLIGAGWTNLQATISYNQDFSGAFGVASAQPVPWWFNRFPQPPSPFTAVDPVATYVTNATDTMWWSLNNTGAGAQITALLLGDPFVLAPP